MKILICSIDNSKSILAGGKHIHQELLEKGLIELGHHVKTVYLDETTTSWKAQRVIHKGLRILGINQFLSLPVQRWNLMLNQLKNRIVHELKTDKPDAISSQDPLAGVAALRAMKETGIKIPLHGTLHGYFTQELVNYSYFASGKEKTTAISYCQAIESEHAQSAKSLICVDSNIAQYAKDQLNFQGKIYTKFNAIDNTRFTPLNSSERLNIKQRFELSLSKPICLIARRLVLKNGVHQALEALSQVHQSGVDFELCIVGSGPEEANLRKQASDLGIETQVKFIGLVPHHEVHLWYQMADVVLMPSTNSDGIEEATSLSMLEGMSCASPVLATAIGGMKEVLRDGENGFLTPDKQPSAMAEKLITILTTPEQSRKNQGKVASEEIQQKYGYLNHAKFFADIFKTK